MAGPLGESAVQDALSATSGWGRPDITIASESFSVALLAAFAADVPAAERAQVLDDLREQAVPRLMQPGVLPETIEVVRPLSRSLGQDLLADLIDLLLDMERELFSAAGDVAGIQDLRLIVVESWALGDESGDRHRAGRLLDLVSRTLSAGVSPAVFSEIAESLRAAWGPFLTDADLPLGLEAIELRPPSRERRRRPGLRLAHPEPHRRAQCPQDRCRLAGNGQAARPGLRPGTGRPRGAGSRRRTEPGSSPAAGREVRGHLLADEPAAATGRGDHRRWYPEIRVETLAGKVASDALRSPAKNADVLVIADRAAAHAATDAIKAARGGRPISTHAAKDGSLVKAVLEGFDESYGKTLAGTAAQRTASKASACRVTVPLVAKKRGHSTRRCRAGKWQQVISSPVSTTWAATSAFHSRGGSSRHRLRPQ